MCWSGEASAVLATVGLGATGYALYKKTPADVCVPLGYFSLMELLQAFTYTVINQCGDTLNQVATLLGYLHITFQPFFINMISLHFVPREVQLRVRWPVYTLCFVCAIIMLLTMYPLPNVGECHWGRPLCGRPLCSVSGNWHIAWQVPLNGWNELLNFDFKPFVKNIYAPYLMMAFLVPALYGSWRLTLYQALVGPVLAKMLTNNPNEWPAIWCLLSIGILLVVVKTRLRQIMYVRSWPLWRLIGLPKKAAPPVAV